MSNTEPRPKVPNTVPYTDEERGLARGFQDTTLQSTAPDRRDIGWKRPVAAVALLSAVAGAAFGVKAMSGGEGSPTPERNPAASAAPNPGETEAPQETETRESNTSEYAPVELTVERYQDGDALVRALNSEYNRWGMSGVELEKSVDWSNPESSIKTIAEEYDDAYMDTLFVSDWQDRPQLYEMVTSFKEQHGIVLNASIMTTDSTQPEDKEPYEQGEEVTMTQVVESTPESMIVSYRYTMWSNADKNRGDLYIENVKGIEGGQTVTFLNENGVWKISDIKYFAG